MPKSLLSVLLALTLSLSFVPFAFAQDLTALTNSDILTMVRATPFLTCKSPKGGRKRSFPDCDVPTDKRLFLPAPLALRIVIKLKG